MLRRRPSRLFKIQQLTAPLISKRNEQRARALEGLKVEAFDSGGVSARGFVIEMMGGRER